MCSVDHPAHRGFWKTRGNTWQVWLSLAWCHVSVIIAAQEAGGSQVQDLSGLQKEALSQKLKLRTKQNKPLKPKQQPSPRSVAKSRDQWGGLFPLELDFWPVTEKPGDPSWYTAHSAVNMRYSVPGIKDGGQKEPIVGTAFLSSFKGLWSLGLSACLGLAGPRSAK